MPDSKDDSVDVIKDVNSYLQTALNVCKGHCQDCKSYNDGLKCDHWTDVGFAVKKYNDKELKSEEIEYYSKGIIKHASAITSNGDYNIYGVKSFSRNIMRLMIYPKIL